MKNNVTYISLFGIIIALGITLAAYWPGLAGPFLLDDYPNLKPTKIDKFDLETLIPAVLNNTSSMVPRIVSVLSLTLNTYLTGFDAFAFKYVNLMIHLVNGLLLFWLGGRLLLSQRSDRISQQQAWLVAGLAATLWLTHPLNVSTVLYVVQRMAQLSMLFTLAAILGYVIGRQRIIRNDTGGLPAIAGSVLGFGSLAVLSKENGALLPLFILLIEATIFRLQTHNARVRQRLIVLLAILCVFPVVSGLVYFISHTDTVMAGYSQREFTPIERLLTESRVLFFYMQLILLPRLSVMSLYHDDFPLVHGLDLLTGLAIVSLAGLVTVAILVRKKAPILTLGIGWFCIAHLLESTIFNLELVYEHRNYMAMWGLLLPIVHYSVKAMRNTTVNRIQYAPVLMIMVVFAGMTAVRAQTWGNPLVFAEVTFRNHPNSSRAATDMAGLALELGEVKKARRYFRYAARLKPLEAGTRIDELLTYCTDDGLPEALLSEAEQRLRNGIVSAYSITALKQIHDDFLTGVCPAADAQTLLTLTDAANSNAPPGFRILFLHANLLARAQELERAGNAYRYAWETGTRLPDQMRAAALVGLTSVQVQQGHLVDAQATLDLLRILNLSPAVNLDDVVTYLSHRVETARQTATPEPNPAATLYSGSK